VIPSIVLDVETTPGTIRRRSSERLIVPSDEHGIATRITCAGLVDVTDVAGAGVEEGEDV